MIIKIETKIEGASKIVAHGENRSITATKRGYDWHGVITTQKGERKDIFIYNSGTMECELSSFTWESVTIK